MNKIKRTITALILTLALITAAVPISAGAAYSTSEEAAAVLIKLGLLRGTDASLELGRAMSRQEAVTLMVRLMGLEGTAADELCPFSDVAPWAKPYAAAAYSNKLVKGRGDGTLGAMTTVTANEFITFVLRALGYDEAEDGFVWSEASEFADKIGLTQGEYGDKSKLFTREDAVLLSYAALTTKMKGSTLKLLEHLMDEGVVNSEDLTGTKLTGYKNYGKPVYTAAEIYERASAATFYVEAYKTEEAYNNSAPTGTGSGFFIAGNGTALITYHQIELMPYARVITTDGRVYEQINVMYYDGYRDIAMIRVGRTDTEGAEVNAFPFIKMGDPETIANGDAVYTISSPLGLQDCISNGIISSVNRIAEDENYPLIQYTAQISMGSSGGALLNEYGEAIGVLMGTFAAGNDLNLAVPINYINGVDRTIEGLSVLKVYENDRKLNDKSTLKLSKYNINMKVGETVEVIVTRDSPGTVSLRYNLSDWYSIGCEWGSFTSKTTIPIYITAYDKCSNVTVTILYADGYGNPNYEAEIFVTVE